MALCGFAAPILAVLLSGIHPVRADDPSYVAAVYEHRVVLNPDPREPVERSAALEHMNKNLDVFEEQTALAAKQGAQIIVFPEDAIHGFNYTRSSIASYLETVPDPGRVTWSPCADPDRFQNTEVLHRLSCMARKNHIFLVANMPDRQVCDRLVDPLCPLDGQYQFNTDVVFSDNGTIVARYHKQNLYFEAAFDAPPKHEYVTFTTPFAGRFGVFTCFDILFREPVVTLVKDMGIRQLVYPTAWMNQLPLLAAVQFQCSFSYSAGVTLLAANVRAAALGMTGSGIFTPWDALHHHDAVGETGKLLVKRLPVLDPSVLEDGAGKAWLLVPFSGHPKVEVAVEESEKEEPWPVSSFSPMQSGPEPGYCPKEDCTEEPIPFTSTMMYDNFTLVALQGREGNLTVCDGSFCCHLLFRRRRTAKRELYALGAFDGLHVVHGTYYLEVCALVRCTGLEKESCGGETEHAQTLVDFHMHGTFSTEHVYAGVLGSGMTLDRPDRSGWGSKGRFYMTRTGMTTGLVTAVLYGRVYEEDSM
ncbi:biotinidase [Pygocentrus nattereri]|uniref:Biotinidase n=1 Tax=Pygocentrus nattereri TaxID=42514 RepID=A0A3B4DSG8_PYGNA|nr:biotinidase [Pygocentrus nattereri]